MQTTRVMVFGATGFLGRHLLAFLSSRDCHIDAASLPGDPLLDKLTGVDDRYSFDVRDAKSVRDCLSESKPDVIFHLAAVLRSNSLSEMLDVNVGGTDNLMAAAQTLEKPPTVVIPGSAAEYGYQRDHIPISEDAPLRPVSIYGISKASQVLTGLSYAARSMVPVVIGRIFNMSGPGEPDNLVCGAMANQISSAESANQTCILRVGDLTGYRDFLDVRDVARGLWHLWLEGQSGEVYNICSGKARRIQSIFDLLKYYARIPVALEQDPTRSRHGEVTYCCGNPEKITRTTGWSPDYTFEETVFATLHCWRTLKGFN